MNKRKHAVPKNVTKTEVKHSELWDGYYFKVFFNGKDYAKFISLTYKTKKESKDKLNQYLTTGKFDFSN